VDVRLSLSIADLFFRFEPAGTDGTNVCTAVLRLPLRGLLDIRTLSRKVPVVLDFFYHLLYEHVMIQLSDTGIRWIQF
jgi:hypothetical protein